MTMLGVNRPPFINRRKVKPLCRYDEMGVLAVVCFTLAAAIIILAMTTGSRMQPKITPVSCKAWSAQCDVRAFPCSCRTA
jgi:hypothetical protein